MKASFRVDVLQPGRPVTQKMRETPILPISRGRPHPLMVMMGLSLILYSAWLYLRIDTLNTAAFLALIIGAVYTWYRQGS
jgi:hypothetical protein